MRLHPAMKSGGRKVIPFRTATMSTQIVAQVRDALFAKELHSGDFLGTEKDLAERFEVSRIVARDALRTLEAQGIVEIKVGAGGGARIARGNARLFAEALAVQLDLAGVSVAEIMDAQRAIECLAAELAAVNSTAEDHARLRELIADAERRSDDVAEFTRLGREFHLAVADASHNRVLVVQLISLQHVSWPARNPHPDAASGAPHSRRSQGTGVAHRDPRRRRCAPADGRARENDRCAARRRAPP